MHTNVVHKVVRLYKRRANLDTISMYTKWGCVVELLLITLLIQGCSWGKEERNEQFYGHFITLDKAKWGEGEEYFLQYL